MATSGSKNYSITRADIVEAALRKQGVYDQGESIPGSESAAADQALNLVIKEWVSRGIDLWLRQEITLFLQPNQKSYQLGTSSTDHATESYVETALSQAYSTAATTLNVTSTAGMTAADNIGIKIDDDSIHWDTVASVDTATTVTITTGLDGAAASGNKVYAYTTKAGRPQKLITAYRRDTSDNDTQVDLIGELEYQAQSNKGSEGPPVQIWYRPTLDTGTLHVWPVDGGSTWDKLVVIGQSIPDDMDAAANNPEFPIEWGNALIWSLAADLSFEYGLPRADRIDLFNIAEKKLENLLDYDVENASVQIALERG